MARPLRLPFAGGVYHVTARGNERKAIVRDDTDRARFVDTLAAEGNWDGAVAAYRGALKKEPFDPLIQPRLEQAKARAAKRRFRTMKG